MSEASGRIEALEIKNAYLEKAQQELSDVLYRLQLQVERLQVQIDALRQHVEQSFVAANPRPPEEEVPPHY